MIEAPSPEKTLSIGNDYENDQSPYRDLVKQFRVEYDQAFKAQVSRIQLILKRLKLYNNQRKDPSTVGDTTLFTVFNSTLSALYEDQMSVEFTGRYEGSEETAEAFQNVAKYDYNEMEKDQFDYFWDWDTLFFGFGIAGLTYFDRERMCAAPELWDPTTFLRDPDALSINGMFNGVGAARFFGREILNRKCDMEDIPSVFDLKDLKLTKPTQSLVEQARQSREDAQGLNNQIRYEEKDMGANARYPIIEWFTWWKHDDLTQGKTKRVMFWIGNDRSKIVRFKVIEKDYWPLVERRLSPTAHQFDGVSIPDLLEDKQRMRAIMLNMAIKKEKAGLYGMYLYNKKKIKNRADLNFDFDKAIPVELTANERLEDAVFPMPRDQVNVAVFNYVMQEISGEGNQATAMPEMQQAKMGKGKNTATEINKVDSKTAIRQGLAAKIWGWSEKDFWEQVYLLYDENFKERIDKKIVRINTAFGPKFKEMIRGNFIGKMPPDVVITSKFQNEQQRNTKRTLFLNFAQMAAQAPGVNVRYMMKRAGKLHDIPKDEVDRIFPPTPDELEARQENDELNKDKYVEVKANQNHEEHLEQHANAKETVSTLAHIATHNHARQLQKQNPELFPQQQQQQQNKQDQNQNVGDQAQQLGKKKPNPQQMGGEGMGMTQMGG
jgi:hypothetical protein